MKIAAANPLWGAPRIHGELGKLGVEVSERAVSRLVRRPRRPPSQTWRTFLTNHVAALGSIDFFTVPTFTGRVLFVFVVPLHYRRRIVHFNVTDHPTAAWTAQQVIDAFRHDTAPRWVLRDRDAIYGEAFQRRVVGMGIGEVLSSPSGPWQNAYCERFIGSVRRECLDHVIVFSAAGLQRLMDLYWRTTNDHGLICRSTRTRRFLVQSLRAARAASWRSRKSAASITDTNAARPDAAVPVLARTSHESQLASAAIIAPLTVNGRP